MRTILLDPGHGLDDRGLWRRPLMYLTPEGKVKIISGKKPHKMDYAPGFYREDIGTFTIATHAQIKLEEFGYKVHLTRGDSKLAKYYLSSLLGGTNWQKKAWGSFKWIKKYAKEIDSDCLVSIHTNAGGGTGISGFYMTPQGLELVKKVSDVVSNKTGFNVRRIAKHAFSVLRHCPPHGRRCLIETGFHDHPKDLEYLSNEGNLIVIGEAIADGIHKYFTDLSGSPTE